MATHQIAAVLHRDAEARYCLGGSWIVMLELSTRRPADLPIVAVHQHGHGEAGRAAAFSEANRLRRGTTARVYCSGIGLGRTIDNRQAIELRGVDAIHAEGALSTHRKDD